MAQRGSEDEEGDEQEAEIDHGGEVDACREFFAFFDAGAFFTSGGGSIEFGHGIGLIRDADLVRFHKHQPGCRIENSRVYLTHRL